jgi:hypothetical protein
MVTARWCARNQSVSTVSMRGSGWVPVTCCPAQRARVNEEHKDHAVTAYEVLLDELLVIRAGM